MWFIVARQCYSVLYMHVRPFTLIFFITVGECKMFVLKEPVFSPFGLASEYAYLSACNGFFQVNGELSQLLADIAENEVTAAMEEEERAIHEQTSKEQQEMMHKVKLWYHNVLSVHPQEFTLHITQKAKTNIFKEYVNKYPKFILVAVTHSNLETQKCQEQVKVQEYPPQNGID